MSNLVGHPEDQFSHEEAQMIPNNSSDRISKLFDLKLCRLTGVFHGHNIQKQVFFLMRIQSHVPY